MVQAAPHVPLGRQTPEAPQSEAAEQAFPTDEAEPSATGLQARAMQNIENSQRWRTGGLLVTQVCIRRAEPSPNGNSST